VKSHLELSQVAFAAMLSKYVKVSKKDIAEIINQKSYWVISKAAKATKIADKGKIQRWFKWNKANSKRLYAYANKNINRSTAAGGWFKGKNYIDDTTAKEFIKKVRAARLRSVAYIKACWTTPFRGFRKAGKIRGPSSIKGARLKGKKKGKYRIAKPSWNPVGMFWNLAGAGVHADRRLPGQLNTQAEATKKYGKKALARAINAEKASMRQYIKRKMQQSARRLGPGRP